MDFGIGAVASTESAEASSSVGGTPTYMAPEAFFETGASGGRIDAVDGRLSDIYSLGVTIFETFTGQLPFQGKNVMDLMLKHVDEEPPRPSSIRPELPAELDDVVLRCLAKDPSKRYQTVDEVREALTSARRRTLTPPPVRIGSDGEAAQQTAEFTGKTVDELQVVVADPDPSVVVVIQEGVRLVASWGVVNAARSVEKALELARRKPTQVLVVPLDNGCLTGREVADLVRADSALNATKVILTTPNASVPDRLQLEAAGDVTILTTPAGPSDVAHAIERVLSM